MRVIYFNGKIIGQVQKKNCRLRMKEAGITKKVVKYYLKGCYK